jgi:hypothetical protein
MEEIPMATRKSLLATGILTGVSALVTPHASAMYCHAYVTQVQVDNTGLLSISASEDPAYAASQRIALNGNPMCDLDSTVGSGTEQISPQVCEKMYSQFVSAYLSGRPVIIWFLQAFGPAPYNSCPTFSSGAPTYTGANPFNGITLR